MESSGQRLLVFCGTGNNGADGRRWLGFSFCAARSDGSHGRGQGALDGEMTCQVAIDRNKGDPGGGV